MGSGARNIIMLHFSNFLKNKIVLPCKHLSALYKKKKKGILIWCIYGGVCQLKPTFERPDFMNAGHFSVMRARASVQAQSAEALQVPNATPWGWPSSNKTSDAVLPLTQRAAWEVGKHPELKVEHSSMNQRRFAEESPSSVQDLCACVCSQEAACF